MRIPQFERNRHGQVGAGGIATDSEVSGIDTPITTVFDRYG